MRVQLLFLTSTILHVYKAHKLTILFVIDTDKYLQRPFMVISRHWPPPVWRSSWYDLQESGFNTTRDNYFVWGRMAYYHQ